LSDWGDGASLEEALEDFEEEGENMGAGALFLWFRFRAALLCRPLAPPPDLHTAPVAYS
jgi:hypothetical protein